MYDLTEFNNLVTTCLVAGWNFEVQDCWDGRQIILKNKDGKALNDVVIHGTSYGHEKGLLETWDSDKDCVGYMDAKEVLEIWAENIVKNESYIAD